MILNQSYEPISICSAKKAILMLILFKAEIVSEREGVLIRSVSQSFPYPSVIRLIHYIRIPYKKVDLTRKNIHCRDGNKCQYCGAKSKMMTVDHIVPKSRGGKDSWENLVTACKFCNNKKGNKTPAEAGMKLLKIPTKPNHIIFIKLYIGIAREDWKPFLFM